jgi:exosortase
MAFFDGTVRRRSATALGEMRSLGLIRVAAGSPAELSGVVFAAAASLVVVLGVLYRSVLPSWFADLWMDPNYSHGVLVPFVSAWLAYDRRAQLAALIPHPSASGLVLVLGSLTLFAAGILAAELFITRISFVFLITSLIIFIFGYAYASALALPLGFLLFMVPLPQLIFNAVALPLQLFASQLAISVLQAVNLPALREGNVILLPNAALEVAEACSGLRSMISLGATSVLLAVLSVRGTWWRVALVASSVVMAVLANGARIAGTGLLAYRYGPTAAEGFFHGFSGWIVFASAVAGLVLEAGLFRRLEQS